MLPIGGGILGIIALVTSALVFASDPRVKTGLLIASSLTLTIAIASFVWVIMDVRRRGRTHELRRLIDKISLYPNDIAEHIIAERVHELVHTKSFDDLSKMDIANFVMRYQVDISFFKRRLYNYLLARLYHARDQITLSDIELAARALDTWRSKGKSFSENLLPRLEPLLRTERQGRRLQRFLNDRPEYFEGVVDNFVVDCKSAVIAAMSKFQCLDKSTGNAEETATEPHLPSASA